LKQLVLDPASGELTLADVPLPGTGRGRALVRVSHSLVSTGTELSKVDVARKSLIEKARDRPDQVAKVIEGVRAEGIVATAKKVRERLGTPLPLGYSLSGVVTACGEECAGISVGMRVACGGATASHAEFVSVPANLVVPIPAQVTTQDAAFATVGAVAMHALRTGGVTLGDRVLIIGLGLLGQIATRLAIAAGAHVFGVDPRTDRAQLAVDSGVGAAQTALDHATAQAVQTWSGGRGADVVLITAGGADSSPLVLAAEAARDRAKVVVVGATSLDIPREPFYQKELTLVVSRSYGPGRYDPEFEEKGYAYPPGFIPWTERRNMEEFLSQIATGRLSLDGLRGIELPFDQAPQGYNTLSGEDGPAPISLVLRYVESLEAQAQPPRRPRAATQPDRAAPRSFQPRPLIVSMVGVGNFATATLLPAISAVSGVSLVHAVASSPLKAEAVRTRWKFATSGTDPVGGLTDPGVDVVFIATRHDSHAAFADAALRANRAVFVEKPLALTPEGLDRVATTLRATGGRLMLGFNRRFAPAIVWALGKLGSDRGGIRFLCRVNAGPLPPNHWLLDLEIGGGRLLGEVCHFIDLACHVIGSEPEEVLCRDRNSGSGMSVLQDVAVEISFANGSTAMIEYVSSGAASLAKERYEIHRQGTSLVIDDFRKAEYHRAGKVARTKWGTRDKGHRAEVRAFLEAVRTGAPTPIPEEESLRTSSLTFAAARSMREGRPVPWEGY